MKYLTIEDLEPLSLGSAILGSGGGGDPAYEILMTRYAFKGQTSIELIKTSELKPDDCVAPVGFMGAPLVSIEKLPSGREFIHLLETLEKTLGKKPTALMPAEIGGANAFPAFMVAAQLGLPVVDGDTLGRAFPELQMSSCNLMGIPPTPAFIADGLGNTVVIRTNSAHTLETIARHTTVSMGSSAALSCYIMTGNEAKNAVIPGTVSQAVRMGKTILKARGENQDPIQAIADEHQGAILASGMIMDIEQTVKEGFLEGSVKILDKGQTIELSYQNEYLLAKKGKEILATTPDIFALLENESGTPITSESLRFGLRVTLLAFPSPKIWQTKQGLELVGPRYFGYGCDYQPITLRSK